MGLPAEERLNYAYSDIPYKEKDKFEKNLPACIVGNWVSSGSQNSIIGKLNDMKKSIVKKDIIDKYDRTINFLETYKRPSARDNIG